MEVTPLAVAALGAIALAGSLSAQTPAPTPFPGVTAGERVRINAVGLAPPTQTAYGALDAPPTTETGAVEWVRNDTIAFSPDKSTSSELTAVPVGHIQRLDVSGGMHRHTLAGLAWGAVGGAAAGAIFGATQPAGFFSQGTNIAAGALLGFAVGVPVGAIVGTLIRTEKWIRVPGYPVAKVSVIPLSGGRVGYGIALNL